MVNVAKDTELCDTESIRDGCTASLSKILVIICSEKNMREEAKMFIISKPSICVRLLK